MIASVNYMPSVSYIRREVALADGIQILDEHIIFRNGPYLRVRRWLRGIHPELGVIVQGYTGWETLVEQDVIRPKYIECCGDC